MTEWFKPAVFEEEEKKVFTSNDVMDMLRKHFNNHAKRYQLGTAEYRLVMRFYEPLQDDFLRAFLGKPPIEFDEKGYQVKD